MTRITVRRKDDVEHLLSRFDVTLVEDGTSTRHTVTLSSADHERLGTAYPTPEAFVHACFAFLLEREPKEQILASFDISEIGRYFPDFERRIQAR